MKRSKRGVTQVDWAISLAIFLLFLIWFFFFTKPLYDNLSNYESLADIVEENFLEDVQLTMTKRPIIIYSNETFTNEPFFTDYSFSDNESHHRFDTNVSFIIENDQLIYIHSTSNSTNAIDLYYSDDEDVTFNTYSPINDLTTRLEWSSVTNFIAYFDNYTIDNVWYDGDRKIFSYKQFLNDVALENESGDYQNTSLYGKYTYASSALNQSFYVIAQNTGILSTMRLNQFVPGVGKTLTVFLSLHNYSNYFVDPIRSGPIDYTFGSCEEFDDINLLDVYDEENGLAIATREKVNASVCGDGTKSNMSITFPLTNKTDFRLQFHEGTYQNGTKYTDFHHTTLGVPVEVEGISLALAENLTDMSYLQLKDEWNFPRSRDFQIEVWNSTSQLYQYEQKEIPPQTNVYTQELFTQTLDINGDTSVVRVFIRVW